MGETVPLPRLDRLVVRTADTDREWLTVWGSLSVDALGELVPPEVEVDERVQVTQPGVPEIESLEGLNRRSTVMKRVLHYCRHGLRGL